MAEDVIDPVMLREIIAVVVMHGFVSGGSFNECHKAGLTVEETRCTMCEESYRIADEMLRAREVRSL